MTAPVFLLSDFGSKDAYVGVMKAVVASLAPRSAVHDLVHDLPPQDLAGARLQLGAAVPYLPNGAVLCAVVDPGVGSERRAVALIAHHPDGRRLSAVGPDNGLLTPLLGAGHAAPPGASGPAAGWKVAAAHLLERTAFGPSGPGTTFDGRDLFAPAAGRLAAGEDPAALGPPLDPHGLQRASDPAPREEPDGWRGEIVWIDRFGNLVSTLTPAQLPGDPSRLRIAVAGRRLQGLSPSFASVPAGTPLAYLGSLGRLEIAIRDGDAAAAFGARVGDDVTILRSG